MTQRPGKRGIARVLQTEGANLGHFSALLSPFTIVLISGVQVMGRRNEDMSKMSV